MVTARAAVTAAAVPVTPASSQEPHHSKKRRTGLHFPVRRGIIKSVKSCLVFEQLPIVYAEEVTAPGLACWGRLLLFGQVDKGDDGTGQNPGLNQQFSEFVNCVPCHYHVYPLLSWGGVQKSPLLHQGERTAAKSPQQLFALPLL